MTAENVTPGVGPDGLGPDGVGPDGAGPVSTNGRGAVGKGWAAASAPVRRLGGRLPHLSRRVVLIGVALLAVAGLTTGIVALTSSGTPQMTLTADFAETPGLYPGNLVDVLGIPVGHIIKVSPQSAYVEVTMHVDAHVRIPANVNAYLMAPNVVNDRYVQLDPPYSKGAQISPGAVIPMQRTADPISVDQVIDSLDQLAVALGPKGANANGALAQLFHAAGTAFAGDGPDLNTTLSSFGQALGSLSSNTADVTSLINNFGSLTHAASQATTTYEAFANDFATVSAALAGDSTDIKQALATLQTALAQVATFVENNSTTLGGSVANLEKVAAAVAKEQQQLAQLLSVSPLALENVANAYDPHPAGGGPPALRARYDPVSGSPAFATSVCGNSVLRLLLLAVDQKQDPIPTIDLACGVASALQVLPIPPGAPHGPNLSLQTLMGAASK